MAGSREEQPLVGQVSSRFGSFRSLSEKEILSVRMSLTDKTPHLLDLGDALATILSMVPLEQR